jgi:NAD(P)-dependent dehydrogenase (short-subunit alcohol dehydrogenase family)
MKTWFITGANRGLGLEIARAALARGDSVVATSRDTGELEEHLAEHGDRMLAAQVNVTDAATIDAAVRAALERFGRIDVLVNNAGYGQLGAFEEITPETIARQFATNVFGVFDVTRAILPAMRAQRSGHVITISSIAGIEGFEGSSVYCSTKHAVSGWSEGVAKEVAPFGIRMTCVYPGRFRTDFLDPSSVRYGEIAIDDYLDFSARRRAALDADNHLQLGDPTKFAEVILTLADETDPPEQFGAGSDAYAVFMKKAASLTGTAERWKALSLSTDFPNRAQADTAA